MVDRQFSEPDLAALYDSFCSWAQRDDFDFYLPYLMSAGAVLDVGCGTGALLHGAREAGHRGRLCGLDPSDAMLSHARTRSDVEWILGDLSSVDWGSTDGNDAFDLVVMTGHAFQVLLDDDEIRTAVEVIRSLLTDDGRFAFETRNPAVRTWEGWIPDNAVEVTGPEGVRVRLAHQVDTPVVGDLVSFTATFSGAGWDAPRISRSTLRFLDSGALSAFLSGAGMVIVEQFGDWDRQPVTEASPEIITIARKATPTSHGAEASNSG